MAGEGFLFYGILAVFKARSSHHDAAGYGHVHQHLERFNYSAASGVLPFEPENELALGQIHRETRDIDRPARVDPRRRMALHDISGLLGCRHVKCYETSGIEPALERGGLDHVEDLRVMRGQAIPTGLNCEGGSGCHYDRGDVGFRKQEV